MTAAKTVLLIGIEPTLIDPADFAPFPGLNAAKVRASLEGDAASLNALGYAAEILWIDLGETAESTLR